MPAEGMVETRRLSEQVNDLLLKWIVASRLEPGQRLKEAELAEELGVSRTPVREALKRLAADGFVTTVPRGGVFVSEIDSQELEEILEIRFVFEIYAAERGVERISQEELSEMRSLVNECESLVESTDRLDYHRYVQKDCDFHRSIVRASGNDLLTEFYERLAVFLQISRVRMLELRPHIAVGHDEHKAILAMYEARGLQGPFAGLGEPPEEIGRGDSSSSGRDPDGVGLQATAMTKGSSTAEE